MKIKSVTSVAQQNLADTFDFIFADNRQAAQRYETASLDSFYELADNLLPKRASQHLPEYVREIGVKGFKGYTLRVAIFESEIYLLNAFAPGLADWQKDAATGQVLDEF